MATPSPNWQHRYIWRLTGLCRGLHSSDERRLKKNSLKNFLRIKHHSFVHFSKYEFNTCIYTRTRTRTHTRLLCGVLQEDKNLSFAVHPGAHYYFLWAEVNQMRHIPVHSPYLIWWEKQKERADMETKMNPGHQETLVSEGSVSGFFFSLKCVQG